MQPAPSSSAESQCNRCECRDALCACDLTKARSCRRVGLEESHVDLVDLEVVVHRREEDRRLTPQQLIQAGWSTHKAVSDT